MDRPPFVQVYSEYHAIVVTMTISLLLLLDVPFRRLLAGWVRSAENHVPELMLLCTCLLIYAWWVAVRPGVHNGLMKRLSAMGLFMTQLLLGGFLGHQGMNSADPLSSILGGVMIALAGYRYVLFRLNLIDLEKHFADIDLQPFGLVISFATASLVVVFAMPFGLSGFETVGIAYLAADILTRTRTELFDDLADV